MRCENCGNEIIKGFQTCLYCGNSIYSIRKENIVEPDRHGFAIFWLYFLLIVNYSLSFVFLIFIPIFYDIKNIFEYIPLIIIIILIILGNFGLILLLRWKKIGFWIFLGSIGVCSFLAINISPFIIISAIITWIVLHLRKNDKTIWEQLKY